LETFKDNWDKIFIIVSEAGNTKASTIVNLDNYTVVREGPYDGKKIIEEIKRYKIFNLESK
jgi:tRNA A37 threonylcarbamoyladenosine synthetase subunit TsaC/SUA5/YrdC